MFNLDCEAYMNACEDNRYDLAIVDPPYGSDNIIGGYTSGKGGGVTKQKDYHKGLWDCKLPNREYFKELVRVSKDQIIWGANHLVTELNNNSSGWVFWDKDNGAVSFSDGELAYTSFNKGLRKFRFRWSGMLQENMKDKQNRIHPTEKPIQLYKWLLTNYAKEGDTILDTHGGSLSIAIACWDLGFDLDVCELDKDYFDSAVKRFEQHISQKQLF